MTVASGLTRDSVALSSRAKAIDPKNQRLSASAREHCANRSRVSHGVTAPKGIIKARSLGCVAASCGSLSAELTGAGFHTEARRHGAWVLCCAVLFFTMDEPPCLRGSV